MTSHFFNLHSLKTRITLSTLAIFVAGLWSLSFYAGHMLREDMARLLGEQQLSTVSVVADHLDYELESRLKGLGIVAGSAAEAMREGSAAMERLLEQRPLLHMLFNGGVIAYDARGIEFADFPASAKRSNVSYLNIDVVAAAIQEGKSTIGRPVHTKRLRSAVFGIGVPIHDAHGKVIGCLVGLVNLGIPNFLDRLSDHRYGKSGYYLLEEPESRLVVTGTEKNRIMETLPAAGVNALVDRQLAGFEGTGVMVNPLGVEVLSSARRVPLAGWVLVAALPTEEAFAPIRAMQRRMVLATVLLTLLAASLTFWLLRRQLSPALATVETLARMSDGRQPAQALPVGRQDEVGQLIAGFNRLLETRDRGRQALQESERLLSESQEVAGLGSYSLDIAGGKWTSSAVFDRVFGIDETHERTVAGWAMLIHPEERDMMVRYFEKIVVGEGRNFDKTYRIVRSNDQAVRWVHGLGHLEFDDRGFARRMHGTIQDVTERKQAEDEVQHLAFTDPLTELPNRKLLMDRLQHALKASARTRRLGSLMLIDLDNFKTVNDTLGHDKGDLLLIDVARRLMHCVREGDTVARLGGDEFVVMLEGLSEIPGEAASQTEAVGEKIFLALKAPYQLTGFESRSTPSIGVALFGDGRASADELVKQADIAMYRSKAAGRNTLRFFDAQMQATVTLRASLETDLREAVHLGQFLLHYQPQVTHDGRLTGAEVLVRWQHPQRGMVSPADFIPLAEETGQIIPLGHWVLETACTQLAAWQTDAETDQLTLAVNVSARQFGLPDFVDQVVATLERTGADPGRLKLELTESLLIDDVDVTIDKMTMLKTRGVSFSLDDFGTGYSSLSYLKRLPLDQLKIDQSFVRDALTDSNDAAIARTIVALGQSLGLAVIAEGVETAEQRDFLAASGCLAYQGYFFSRPLPLAAFEDFARQRCSSGATKAVAAQAHATARQSAPQL